MFISTGQGRQAILVLFLLILSTGTASTTYALNFNAFWTYREKGVEGVDTTRQFQQTYRLGAGPTLTFQPTRAISARFFLDYSRIQQNQGKQRGWVTIDRLTPTAAISVVNDIFAAKLSGYVTQTRLSNSSSRPTDRSWDASIGSSWQIPFWPSLGFSYGERTEENRGTGLVNESGNREKHTGISVNWDLLLAQLFYQYNRTEAEDFSSGSLREARTHFGRMETGGRFWENRFQFNLSQQVAYSYQDLSIGALQDGTFDQKLVAESLSSAVTDPQVLNDPPEGQSWGDDEVDLATNPVLGNGVLNDTGALDVPPDRRLHLGVSFSFDQQVDTVRVYLHPLTPLSASQAATLQWDLYLRNAFDTGWELAAANIPATYDAEDKLFNLAINRRERQIMVVAVMPSDISLTITEVEAFSQFTQNTSTRSVNYLGNFGTSIRLTRTLTASSQVGLEQNNSENSDFSRDFSRLSMSGRLGWSPTPLLSPSIGFSEIREEQTGRENSTDRSYSLIMTSLPLPTLNLSFGVTRTERYIDDLKTRASDNYSLTSAAQIYPDLSASLNLNYREAESLDSDGNLLTSDSYGTRLDLNARLTRSLIADLTTDYFFSESDTGGLSSARSTLNLLYRPSDVLSLNLAGTKAWTEAGGTDSASLNLNLWLLRTQKTRLNFRYSRFQATTASDSFRLDWSWNISKAWYLQTKFNYTQAEQYRYSFDAFLSFRL